MKKEHFIELCKTDPEEVFKLFCMMGETITTLQAQVVVLNKQVESLQAEVKELKERVKIVVRKPVVKKATLGTPLR